MKINEFDYHFKLRPIKDVALNMGVIYKNLGYSKINKDNISKIFGITEQDILAEDYVYNLACKVEQFNGNNNDLLEVCEQLQHRWEGYRDDYFKILKKAFDIDIDRDIKTHTYCYLQALPINEVNLHDNIIYLDYNKSVDEIFKTFIIMLTKLILINRWNDTNRWEFNTEFDVRNKVWIFAEIAIDAVFAGSDLSIICDRPTYKYFYNLEDNGKNVMATFRELYHKVSLDEFFTEVYMFVYKNYNKLLQFKNYLY